MRFRSTRHETGATLSAALWRGLAPDGGLYLPAELPALSPGEWREMLRASLPETAERLLGPFVHGSRGSGLEAGELRRIVADTFNFSIPLTPLENGVWLLELFRGPTLAFKDVGARFLARMLPALLPPTSYTSGPATILVATSGDTGGAVAQAFHGVAGTRVVVLYPDGQVSPLQERLLATLGGNVLALAIDGTFDDCQRLVKEAFTDRELGREMRLTSANSINLGRLLPQMVHYAWGRAQLAGRFGIEEPPIFCVPSGNFGNLTAGLLAERMGLPARRFIAATNANDVVPDYLASGIFRPRASVPTLANAMDVGDPSNLERIRDLFADDLEAIRRRVWASSHPDRKIRAVIRRVFERTGTILDPHTAVGRLALDRYRSETGDETPAILLATAHPAKFREVVEPILGEKIPLPGALASAPDRPLLRRKMAADLSALRRTLREQPVG